MDLLGSGIATPILSIVSLEGKFQILQFLEFVLILRKKGRNQLDAHKLPLFFSQEHPESEKSSIFKIFLES